MTIFHPVFGGGRKNFQDGVVHFVAHFEALDGSLGQLRVTHQFGDDLIGVLHFLADDLDLLIDVLSSFFCRCFSIPHGALQAKGGVGDDAQGDF